MAWSAPVIRYTGDIITATIWNESNYFNLRYLKGIDGVPTTESGLVIDNTGGDEYLLFPLLSTAECDTILAAEGKFAFDEQTHTPKYYNGSAVKDIGDHGGLAGLTDDDHTQYQKESLLTTAGDIPYATGDSAWARRAIGTANQLLRTNAGATAPEWASVGLTFTELVGGENKVVTTASTWQDYDLSAIIGAGSVAVLVGIYPQTVGITAGARDNGSALNRYFAFGNLSYRVLLQTECDANRIIEIYDNDASKLTQFSILGYWN